MIPTRVALGGGIASGGFWFGPFVKQKSPQCPQVVEQPAAGLQVMFQLIQFKLNDAQSFQSAIRLGCGGRVDVGCDLGLSFRDCLDQ